MCDPAASIEFLRRTTSSVQKSQPVLSASDGAAISLRESIGAGPC